MSATPNINPLKIKGNKFDATQGPTSGDDINDGYNVGSIWIDVSANKAYTCVDATAGNAVWNESGGSGGGGNNIYNSNGTLVSNIIVTQGNKTLTFDGAGGFPIIKQTEGAGTNGQKVLEIKANHVGSVTGCGGYIDFSSANGNYNVGRIHNYQFGSSNAGFRFYSLATDGTANLGSSYLGQDGHAALIGENVVARVSTEKISLQGNTLIKGSDNSASTSGFKFIDSSNNSKWDFRNNGDVHLGQDTSLDLNSNTLTVKSSDFIGFSLYRPASAANYATGIDFSLNNSSSAKTSYADIYAQIVSGSAGSENSNLTFRVADSGSLGIKLTVNTGGIVVAGNTTSESTSSNAAFIAKGDNSSVDGYIQLNCWNNNHGIKLKSPPHSAGATYTLVFPDNTGSNGQALTTDGSGNLSWGAGTSTDSDAIHDNVASEISAIAAKTTLVNNDILLIEDSADSNNKKKTTIADIKTAVSDVGTPGIAQSINSFALANTTTNSAIINAVYSVKVIPTVLRDVTKMSFFVTSIAAGQITSVGIYNNSGTLLAQGSVAASALGIRTANLNTTVTLAANTEYYFSIWDSNGTANYASKALFNLDILGKAGTHSSSTLPNSMPGSATNKCFWLNAF